MDTRHWHVISKLAEAFDVKEGVVTNFIRRVWGSRLHARLRGAARRKASFCSFSWRHCSRLRVRARALRRGRPSARAALAGQPIGFCAQLQRRLAARTLYHNAPRRGLSERVERAALPVAAVARPRRGAARLTQSLRAALVNCSDRYKETLDEFWLPTGPPKLVFFFQARASG